MRYNYKIGYGETRSREANKSVFKIGFKDESHLKISKNIY